MAPFSVPDLKLVGRGEYGRLGVAKRIQCLETLQILITFPVRTEAWLQECLRPCLPKFKWYNCKAWTLFSCTAYIYKLIVWSEQTFQMLFLSTCIGYRFFLHALLSASAVPYGNGAIDRVASFHNFRAISKETILWFCGRKKKCKNMKSWSSNVGALSWRSTMSRLQIC